MVLDKFRAPRRFEPILEIIYLEMSWQLSSTQLIENHRIDTSILVARNRYLIADRLRFSLVLVIRLSLTNVSTSIRNPFVPRVIANSPGNRFVTRSRNFHITIAVSNPMRECAVKNSHRFRILSKDTNTVKERRLWCRRNNNTNYRQRNWPSIGKLSRLHAPFRSWISSNLLLFFLKRTFWAFDLKTYRKI